MGNHVVWSSTRARVRGLVEAVASGESALSNIVAALLNLEREGDDSADAVVGALAEFVGRGDGRPPVVAAAMVLWISRQFPSRVSSDVALRARTVIADSLRAGDEIEQALGCVMLGIGVVPTACIPRLFELLHAETETLRVAAALALSTVDAREVHALAVGPDGAEARLRGYELSFADVIRTLDSSVADHHDSAIRCLALGGLIRLLPDHVEFARKAAALLLALAPELQFGLITAVEHSETTSATVIDALATLAGKPGVEPAVRGCAARVLGVLTKGTRRAETTLVEAFNSNEPVVIRGAVLGMQSASLVSAAATPRLVELVSCDSEQLRILAMAGLATVVPPSQQVANALVNRIGRELTQDASRALLNALEHAGSVAIPGLIELIKSGDIVRRHIAALALGGLGLEGARATFQLVQSDSRSEMLEALVFVINCCGTSAEPLVPDLVEALETCTSGEMLAMLTLCVCLTQSRRLEALQALVATVLYAPDEVADYVERYLRGIGAAVVPVLREALEGSAGGDLKRVERLLRELEGASPPDAARRADVSLQDRGGAERFRRFTVFDDDRRLMTFVYVAREWDEHGSMSLRAIATTLDKRRADGQLAPGHSLRLRTIYDHIRSVQNWWSEPLVTYTEGRAGGLTEAGRAFLRELEAYFEFKYGRHLS